MIKSILKNSSYLLIAQFIAKIASFFYAFFLARQLGVVEFGNYSVALSYFAILSSVVDLGVSRYLIREVSKQAVLFSALFVNALVLRLVFSVSLVAGFGIILYLTDSDQIRVLLSLVAAFTVIPQSVGLTFDAGLIVKNKFKYSALGILLLNFSTIILGVVLIENGATAMNALVAVVLGHILYMSGVLLLLFLSTKDLKNIWQHVSTKTISEIVKGSLLYGIMSMVGLIYFKVDTLLLSYLRGPYDAGIYSAAYRFLEGIIFIPSAFEIAFFPVLSKMHQGSKSLFGLYLKSVGLLILLSVPFVISFWFLVPVLITSYLQITYSPSIEVVKILALAVPCIFALAAQGALLLSSEKYLRILLGVSLFNLVFNILGNILFIPVYGYIASAWMTVLSQTVAFFVYFVIIYFAFGRRINE